MPAPYFYAGIDYAVIVLIHYSNIIISHFLLAYLCVRAMMCVEAKMNDPDKKMREYRERAKREMAYSIRRQLEVMRHANIEKREEEERKKNGR